MRVSKRQVIENIHRYELTSKEREDAITELWIGDKYRTQKELGKILGLSEAYISVLLKAKSTRDKLEGIEKNLISKFPTKTLMEISPLPKAHQAKVLKKINEEKLAPF